MSRQSIGLTDNLKMTSIIVDQESLRASDFGLTTLGQLLRHLHQSGRLITRLVIDGECPDLDTLPTLQGKSLEGQTIFIETADPHQTAIEALEQIESQLPAADQAKNAAAECLRANQWPGAMEHLAVCVTRWQEAQKAIVAVSRLFKIDLDRLVVTGRPLNDLSCQLASQLREIQTALQSADLVGLTDLLVYETENTSEQWRSAVHALRMAISVPMHVQSAA
jgi:hypothetical protein